MPETSLVAAGAASGDPKRQSADLGDILAFLQLTQAELAAVSALGARLEGRLTSLTRAFYRRVTSVPALRAIIEAHSSIQALERTFFQYLVELFQGRVDQEYIQRRKAIGRAHVRVSLPPAWYLAAYGVLWEEVLKELGEQGRAGARWRLRLLSPGAGQPAAAELETALAGLHKLVILDALLAIETYRERELVGHLDQQRDAHQAQLKALAERLASLSQQLASLSQQAAASVDRLRAAASGLDGDAAAIAGSTAQTAQEAGESSRLAQAAAEQARGAGDSVQRTFQSVGALAQRIDGLTRVAEAIEQVADQTNLLALNAAIEAARAGEQGRGFAVVAEEVRRLADQSRQLVQGVQQELGALMSEAKQAVSVAQEGYRQAIASADKSQEVGSALQRIAARMAEGAAASGRLREAAGGLHRSLGELAQGAKELAAQATQVADLADQLAMSGAGVEPLVGARHSVRTGAAGAQA